MMTYAERISYIAILCETFDVPYELHELYDGMQLRFPWCEGDVACHSGTYGNEHGAVETYMFPWDDDDVSVLLPKEAALKIINYYYELYPNFE